MMKVLLVHSKRSFNFIFFQQQTRKSLENWTVFDCLIRAATDKSIFKIGSIIIAATATKSQFIQFHNAIVLISRIITATAHQVSKCVFSIPEKIEFRTEKLMKTIFSSFSPDWMNWLVFGCVIERQCIPINANRISIHPSTIVCSLQNAEIEEQKTRLLC